MGGAALVARAGSGPDQCSAAWYGSGRDGGRLDVDGRAELLLQVDEVRNGYQDVTVRFTVKGDAPAAKLRQIVEQSRARSAVYDVITNQVPVTIEIDTD